jgi:hypothetical protein
MFGSDIDGLAVDWKDGVSPEEKKVAEAEFENGLRNIGIAPEIPDEFQEGDIIIWDKNKIIRVSGCGRLDDRDRTKRRSSLFRTWNTMSVAKRDLLRRMHGLSVIASLSRYIEPVLSLASKDKMQILRELENGGHISSVRNTIGIRYQGHEGIGMIEYALTPFTPDTTASSIGKVSMLKDKLAEEIGKDGHALILRPEGYDIFGESEKLLTLGFDKTHIIIASSIGEAQQAVEGKYVAVVINRLGPDVIEELKAILPYLEYAGDIGCSIAGAAGELDMWV